MPPPKRSYEAQIDAVFGRVHSLDPGFLELRADFARYLCVMVSGYLDQTIRELVSDFARVRSQPVIANLVVKLTERTTNFKSSKIREQFLMIDPRWEAQIEVLLDERTKAAVDSVVALRHRIAHGESADVTVARMTDYYSDIKKLMGALRALMGLA